MRVAAFVFLMALALAGCRGSGEKIAEGGNPLSAGVRYVHDDEHGVSCWLAYEGISCLPDSQVQRP